MDIKNIIKIVFLLTLLIFNLFSVAQNIKFINADEFVRIGKADSELNFHRIEDCTLREMPKNIQTLAKHSSGIAVIFETNSSCIAAKWQLADTAYYANLTPVAQSGLDLYCLRNGEWQFVNVAKPKRGLCQEVAIISNMDTTTKQFMLYLPLFNSVTNLEIGFDSSAWAGKPKLLGIDVSKNIVVYGSSIVQGASASRPGMTYTSIVQRNLHLNIINLGLSGSVKMELALAKYITSIPAICYILDCVPNTSPQQITKKTYPFIKYLSMSKPKIPILIIESIFRENGYFDKEVKDFVKRQNDALFKACKQLWTEGYRNIFYLSSDNLIGKDHESTIDGTHLTDLGFVRISDKILPYLKRILKEYSTNRD
ncbi:MAG: SGNH/GDSL hydrolase family protein [Sphingobacteriales bacterium]|nr:SGNH/GDSL hydrolase family protein [Sphingobacteriales bacterium]